MAIMVEDIESSVVYDKNEYTITGGEITAFLPEEEDTYNVTLVGPSCNVTITNDARSIIMRGTVNYETKESTTQKLTIAASPATIDVVAFGLAGQKLILPSNGNYTVNSVTGVGEITIGNNCDVAIGEIKSEQLSINLFGNCSVLRITGKGAYVTMSGRFSFVYASFATVTILDNAVYCTVIGNNNEILCNEKSAFSTILGNDNRVTDLGIGNKTGVEPVSGGSLAEGKFGNITIADNTVSSNTEEIIINNLTSFDGSVNIAGATTISGSVSVGGALIVAGNAISGTNTGDQTITLSGEVTGSGTSGIFASINNNAVIAKTLTNFANTTGTVSSSDTILSALQKINGNVALLIDGSGVVNQVPFFSATRTISSTSTYTYTSATGLTIGNSTASTSASSGALVVSGGVGIGGNVFIGGNLTVSGTLTASIAGDVTGTTAASTIANTVIMGKTLGSFTSGAGIVASTDTLLGALQKINGNVALAVTGSGSSGQVPFLNGSRTIIGATTFTYAAATGLTIGNSTASTNASSGALVVSGGVGIGGNVFIGGNATITGTLTASIAGDVTGTTAASTIANTIIMGKTLGSFTSGAGTVTSSDTLLGALQKINGNVALAVTGSGSSGQVPFLNGARTVIGATTFTYAAASGLTIGNNTTSTNSSSGALIVTGGAGIGGNVFIGGNLSVTGTVTIPIAGDVTGTTVSSTIANTVIMSKTLGSFTSGAGVITGSDTLLSALQKLDGNRSNGITGTGDAVNGFAYFTDANTLATTNNVVLNGDKIQANGIITNTIDGGSNNDISLITSGNNRVALSGPPINDNHAVTKIYTDTIFSQWTRTKPTDSAVINSTTLRDDSDFSGVPFTAGIYRIIGILHVFSISNTPDIRIAINYTGTATISKLLIKYSKYTHNSNTINNLIQNVLTTPVSVAITGNNQTEYIDVSGFIIVTSANSDANFRVQWAQNTNDSTNSTIVRAGSFVTVIKIA